MASTSCIDWEIAAQGFLRPGQWCLGCRGIRRARQMWNVKASAADAKGHFIALFEKSAEEGGLSIVQRSELYAPRTTIYNSTCLNCYTEKSLTIHLVTKLGWLDTLDVVFVDNSGAEGGSRVYHTLGSTGLLTVTNCWALPGNVLCCWFPFGSEIQWGRLRRLREILESKLQITSHSDLFYL